MREDFEYKKNKWNKRKEKSAWNMFGRLDT